MPESAPKLLEFSREQKLCAGALEKRQMSFGDSAFASKHLQVTPNNPSLLKAGLARQFLEFVRFVKAQP